MKIFLLTLAALLPSAAFADHHEKGKGQPISLFNGKDLTGWHADIPAADNKPDLKSSFVARNGMVVSLGSPNGHLITDKKYSNFKLAVEYRFPGKPGNCGVLVHASTPRALYEMFPASIEVQMNSGHAGDFWCIHENIVVPDMEKRRPRGKNQKWGGKRGDSRRILNLTDGTEKPLGEWNKMLIECRGKEVIVHLNGVLVNHGKECSVSEGQISIQAEGAVVEFRKMELTSLEK
jgi:hypothetical protein